MDICARIVSELGLKEFQVSSTLQLFKEGGTVPFIARYRKERTGNLDEEQIREVQHKFEYYTELDERKTTILDSIREQGKLSPELEKKILGTLAKTELEDLYLPYKPKRTTRATKARDAGLEPLSRWLVALETPSFDLLTEAGRHLNPEKEVDTAQKALQGACDILAEELSDDADVRKWMREFSLSKGIMRSTVKKEFAGQKTKFDMYHDFHEQVKTLPSHRILALLRGEKEKVIRVSLEIPQDEAVVFLESRLVRHPQSASAPVLRQTAADSLERLLMLATETEIRMEMKERGDQEAIAVFAENLKTLLLAPPAGQKPVMGIDPGFRSGCKVVVMDSTGKFLEYQTTFPHEPQRRDVEAREIISGLIRKYGVALIAIGNGTAGRETDVFIRAVLGELPPDVRPVSVVVNESGASVYSASEVAIKEFPDQDVTVRGAISIGRRLQDPLSELVKVDPKAIGVGQYQHDVNQRKLKERLDEVVESCVNMVGVDVNLASEELLKHVSGLNRTVAKNVVAYRNQHGAFASRADLRKVGGMGEKTFEQCAGFLRVSGGVNPLDNSSVHPERYPFVEKLVSELKTTIGELVGNTTLLKTLDKTRLITPELGLPTIEDIFSELEKPGRDPRASFKYATFSDAVREVSDLKPGMELEGNVTNVANFGAFVDIGVHQDGLIHISELSDRFVTDPRTVVKVGQIVKVRVLDVDGQRKRIALSMKTAQAGPAAHQDSQERPKQSHPAPRQPSMGDLQRKHQANGDGKLFMVKPKFNLKQIMH